MMNSNNNPETDNIKTEHPIRMVSDLNDRVRELRNQVVGINDRLSMVLERLVRGPRPEVGGATKGAGADIPEERPEILQLCANLDELDCLLEITRGCIGSLEEI